MANSTVDKIDDACPPISVFSGGGVGLVPDASPAVEAANVQVIDLGDADVSGGPANSAAIGVRANYASNFDDSVFWDGTWGTKTRIWCAQKPLNTLNTIMAEFTSTALLPLIAITADLTNGAEIPGDPRSATAGDSAIYNAATKKLEWLLLQLKAVDVGNVDFDQVTQIHGAPVVYIETPRMDPTLTRLRPDDFSMDTEAGHFFNYTDVQLFIQDANANFTLIGGGQNVNSILEDTIELESTEEHVKWEKGKPKAAYQTARTSLVSGINFKLDQDVASVMALAHQVRATEDLVRGKVAVSINAKSARTIESVYMLRFRSHGGFLMEIISERGILSESSSFAPGTEWAGKSFHIDCLVNGPTLETINYTYSSVATETLFKPLIYTVTT